VTSTEPEQVGLLVLRIWPEPGSPSGVRARVHFTTDLGAKAERSVVVDTREAIADVLARFLDSYLASRSR